MKANEINDWLGVVTNLGVIAGLALVAYELHQNSLALERDERQAQVEVLDGLRGAWQNWEYSIIENADLSDIWMRGNADEELDRLEEFRFQQLAKEQFRLISQNYRQYTAMSGEPADHIIQQLIETSQWSNRLRKVFIQELSRPTRTTQNTFKQRVRELDPPELRLTADADSK